jgi:hypothetical protein
VKSKVSSVIRDVFEFEEGRLYWRRGAGLGWSAYPELQHFDGDDSCNEQYGAFGDAGDQELALGGDNVPLGLRRFKAGTEAWRRRLQAQLLLAPLTAADRVRLMRWVNNLRAREAWQAARLEHTIATKRLLLEALSGGTPPRSRDATPAAEKTATAEDREDT